MDFSVEAFKGLGQADRQRLCRQIRRRQVENYLEYVAREQQSQPQPPRQLPRKPNRRNTAVHFLGEVCLQNAVEEDDEKEVLRMLHSGADFNFATGNGTTLLHKCCAEGNLAVAELLILKGADINVRDDDWWTPLHVACYQDNADIVQLLLTNGADVSVLDVDGNIPLDHAPKNTDTWDTVISFMEAKGLSEGKVKKLRQTRAQQVEAEIRGLIRTKGDLNTALNDWRVTLLHVASANGYTKCGKLLLKHGAGINMTTAAGWTPLHCAAKFSQTKMAEVLIKNGADTKAVDNSGNRALDLASDEEIQKLILEARRAERQSVSQLDGREDTGDTTDEEEGVLTKIIRPAHLPLSKADRLSEGEVLLHAHLSGGPSFSEGPVTSEDLDSQIKGDEEEIYEVLFASDIYCLAGPGESQLPVWSTQDDLSALSTLSETVILNTVLQRYRQKLIYTYMGDVLIALNPFCDLPIYGKWACILYHEAQNLTTMTPHVYAVAERARRLMMSSHSSQCCVIGGESGAGKTETTKIFVQHLMSSTQSSEHQLNSKLRQINPLLEGFGNARTTMNSNSSRFAKYLELIFTPSGCVLGGYIHQYLLEKSRVVHQGALEGNFHIFYWLLAGATPEEKTQCCLDGTFFSYLQPDTKNMVPPPQPAHSRNKLLEVKECMKFVGFSQDDVSNMLKTVAAVLHLGNVAFADRGDHEMVMVKDPGALRKVSALLRVPYEDLVSALTEDFLTARGEELRKCLSVSQACDNRNALAKALYSRLFAWIVNGLNQMVAPLEDAPSERLSIGILDIFGFENLQVNGFEQMCINLANEQLQVFYQQQMFEHEHQDCLSEGVQPVDITFPSSQRVIEVFMEKNTGIYDLLDEESSFPKASEETLATKLHTYPGKQHNQVYKTPRYGGPNFTIVHYAGAVQYQLEGVLEKNRDALRNSLSFVMRSSDSLLVKELFQAAITKTGSISPSARQRVSRVSLKMKASKSPFEFFKKLRQSKHDNRGKRDHRAGERDMSKKQPSTLTYHFKNSLRDMLSKLESSTPHFIRCIKPSTMGEALNADPEYVSAQLRYTGVLQTTILRKKGYAVRCTFKEFTERYSGLAAFSKPATAAEDNRGKTVNILKAANISEAQLGHSKVFLRLGQVQTLDTSNAQITSRVIITQSAARRFVAKRLAEKRRKAREEYHRRLLIQQEMECAEAERKKAAEEEKQETGEENRKGSGEGPHHYEEIFDIVARHTPGNLSQVPVDIHRSLEFLDSVISEHCPSDPFDDDDGDQETGGGITIDDQGESEPLYTEAFSPTGEADNNHNLDDAYTDVASLAQQLTSSEMHRKHIHHPTPCYPHDVVLDPSRAFPPSPREMYSYQTGFNHAAANGHQHPGIKRLPPQVPERSPDTQLTSQSSRKSSISSRESISSADLCNELNEVFDSPHHNYDPSAAGSSSSRFQDSRPFSYAAGIDPKVLQQRQHGASNGNLTKSRVVSEGYPTGDGQGRGFQPYAEYRKNEAAKSAPGSVNGVVNSGDGSQMGYPPQGHAFQGSSSWQQQPIGGQQGYPYSPTHSQPPLTPAQMYGGQRGPQPPPGGVSLPGPLSSPRHGHTHHHIVTKPHPSPPVSRRSSSSSSPSRGSVNSAFQPVASQSAGSAPPPPPPSFPAPPPPVPLQQRYVAATQETRSPSPPLPPPPPDFFPAARVDNRKNVRAVPPAASASPMSPRAVHHSRDEGRTNGTHGNQISSAMMAELSQVKLKRTAPPENNVTQQTVQESERSQSPLGVRLKPTGGKFSNIYQGGVEGSAASPDMEVPDDLPPPPPPQPEYMAYRVPDIPSYDAPPPPPPPTSFASSSHPPVATSEPPFINSPDQEGQVVVALSKMEIDIPDDIDISKCPGLVEITKATPNWKREMIEKKNREKIEEYVKLILKERENEAKWKNVPEWKRALLMKKDVEDQEKELEKFAAAEGNKKTPPPPRGGGGSKGGHEPPPPMPKPKGDIKAAALSIDPAELESMPPWKRELLLKREKVPATFFNEFNPDEDDEKNTGGAIELVTDTDQS